jgi:hypothetical protein
MSKTKLPEHMQAIELLIHKHEPNFSFPDISREVCRKFSVRTLSRIPAETVPEVIDYLQWSLSIITASNLLKIVLPQFLAARKESSTYLMDRMKTKLFERFGHEYWARMTEEEASEFLWNDVGNMNLWEYTFRPEIESFKGA